MGNMRDFQSGQDNIVLLDDNEHIPQLHFEDSGGLGEFHTNADVEEAGTSRSKILAGLLVGLLVVGAGTYAYTIWAAQQPKVADSHLPQPTAPTNAAAMTPPAPVPSEQATAPADTSTATATTPATPEVVKPAPVTRQARVGAPSASPRTEAAPQFTAPATPQTGVAPPENQAVIAPDPVSPTPPVAVQAGNPPLNLQSATPDETPAPAAPQAQPETQTTPAPAPEAPATAQ